MKTSVSADANPADASLLSISWRGLKFGAKFSFWFVLACATLPIAVNVSIKVAKRPHAWKRTIFSEQGVARYIIPAVIAPPLGAGLGGVAAAILFPAASLLNGRSTSGRWETFDLPLSPFDDMPAVHRSREELLRRIVIHGPPDLAGHR